MRQLIKSILLLLLSMGIMGWKAQALGGVIKVETQTTVKTTGDLLEIIITARNNGTSPAHNVQTNLLVLGEKLKAPVASVIKPGDSNDLQAADISDKGLKVLKR